MTSEKGTPDGAGQGGPGGAGGRWDDCVRFEIPWHAVDAQCLPKKGFLGLGGEYTGQELENLCGDPPCVFGWRDVPTPSEIDDATSDLDIDVSSAPDQDWVDLVSCAWAMLEENIALIQFIMCTLTGNPDAGDCIAGRISGDKPTISFNDDPDPPAEATVFDWDSVQDGIKLGALGGAVVGWNGAIIGSVVGAIAGAVVGGVVTTFAHLGDIILYTNAESPSNALERWKDGDKECACAYMASLLLHEISHSCLRNLDDPLGVSECAVSTMLQNSFMHLIAERYEAVGASGCCAGYLESSTWWSNAHPDFCNYILSGGSPHVPDDAPPGYKGDEWLTPIG